MGSRLDVLKSLMRGAATGARARLLEAGPIARARSAFAELARQRSLISDEELAQAIAHGQDVRAASVRSSDGAVAVDVSFRSGSDYAARLIPLGARFAPRGAKEIRFRVEPPDRARGPEAAEIASALAGAIARSLFRGLLPGDRAGTAGAIVDRDDDVLRIDLRTLPALRRLDSRGALGLVMDVVEIRAIRADSGGLSVELKLPDLRM